MNPRAFLKFYAPIIVALIGVSGVIIAALINHPQPAAISLPTQTSTPSTPIAVIRQHGVTVREGPNASFSALDATLDPGDQVDVLASSVGWFQVLLADGRTGWIRASSSTVNVGGNRALIVEVTLTTAPTITSMPTLLPTLTYTLLPNLTPASPSATIPASPTLGLVTQKTPTPDFRAFGAVTITIPDEPISTSIPIDSTLPPISTPIPQDTLPPISTQIPTEANG